MPYEQRDNSGSLFRNDRKETENHPDYTGKCMVNGEEMRMAAWLKEAKNGTKWMSFSFSEPREAKAPTQSPLSGNGEADSEDIPF